MGMLDRIRLWFTLDSRTDADSADDPHAPLGPTQRRDAGPLLTLAFGWGFLITGLFVGGSLATGLPFWPDLILDALWGNLVNFVIGALVGYMGYRTACNSGLLYRLTYGNVGASVPVLFLALLTIGWQGIVVGAFGLVWAGSFDSPWFIPIALFAGVLYTVTTLFGVKGLEKVAVPSTVVLVLVGIYAAWLNIDRAGGWDGFLALSNAASTKAPLTHVNAINIVIGSWVVGAIVMAEYTRFAKSAWVSIAIPFVVLVATQLFLQVIGAMGGIVSGNFDFSAYMRTAGFVIGGIGLIAMSLALWTTGDTNLYLPAIQTASVFRKPKRVMVVICGALGTILGLGIYQHFMTWIDQIATLVPPIIGPVIVDYYVFHRQNYRTDFLDRLPAWNPAAMFAALTGIVAAYMLTPSWIAAGLFGVIVSMLAYLVYYGLSAAIGWRMGYGRALVDVRQD